MVRRNRGRTERGRESENRGRTEEEQREGGRGRIERGRGRTEEAQKEGERGRERENTKGYTDDQHREIKRHIEVYKRKGGQARNEGCSLLPSRPQLRPNLLSLTAFHCRKQSERSTEPNHAVRNIPPTLSSPHASFHSPSLLSLSLSVSLTLAEPLLFSLC